MSQEWGARSSSATMCATAQGTIFPTSHSWSVISRGVLSQTSRATSGRETCSICLWHCPTLRRSRRWRTWPRGCNTSFRAACAERNYFEVRWGWIGPRRCFHPSGEMKRRETRDGHRCSLWRSRSQPAGHCPWRVGSSSEMTPTPMAQVKNEPTAHAAATKTPSPVPSATGRRSPHSESACPPANVCVCVGEGGRWQTTERRRVNRALKWDAAISLSEYRRSTLHQTARSAQEEAQEVQSVIATRHAAAGHAQRPGARTRDGSPLRPRRAERNGAPEAGGVRPGHTEGTLWEGEPCPVLKLAEVGPLGNEVL